MTQKTIFHAFILLAFCLPANAQQDTTFWFVAPETAQASNNLDRPVAFRFSTYGSPAIIELSQPADPAIPPQAISLAANTSGVLEFPPYFEEVENTPPNTVLNKGFLIRSTSPISAYYEILGTVPNNPEIFALKGKNALGTNFFVPFQTLIENSSAYFPTPHAAFDIVATENNTQVTITPTKAIVGHVANLPFTITLHRGQTYSAEATGQSALARPAGSRVVSDKPIAITVKDDLLEGGQVFGGFCRDVVGDQIVPVEKIGTKYVVQKGFLNDVERAFVLATAPGTQVIMDGVLQNVINAGQTLEIIITNGSHFVETSAPTYVFQLTGTNCELAGATLPALDCGGSSSVRFVRTTSEEFYLYLVTKNGDQSGFALNGSNSLVPASNFQIVPGSNGEYVAAVFPFSDFQVPSGQSSVVENSLGTFQMAFLNGGFNTGCRFGYFSDFCKESPISTIVNDYTPVLSLSGCDNSVLQVGSAAAFSPGDEVLIIQMKGATVNLSNTANFGNIANPGNAGNFEFNRIKSIVGNQITLLNKTVKDYDINGKAQLIRVPEYDDYTATDLLTCKPWDGFTGGVLVLDVAGTLTLGNGADVSGRGFQGGAVDDGNVSFYHETGYVYQPDPDLAAAKGEGIADFNFNQSYGRGKIANGGGGGNAHNGGGGGGGNGGAGGNGGLEYWIAPDAPTPGTDGIGGLKVFETNNQKITLGGGGGAGHTNDEVGTSGGNGGGIIILRAGTLVSNGAVLAANGADVTADGDNRNDGQGGGGAGGSILIEANQIIGTLTCELKGGRGGDCLFFVQEQIIGPGGGGGGGKLMLSQNFPNVTANLNGGENGIANQNLPNGALPGQPGTTLSGVSIPEGSEPAGTISIAQTFTFCPGSSVTINGIAYNQPGTIVDTIPGTAGCDTVTTYTLQYAPTDFVFQIEDFVCTEGRIDMKYSLCNLGSGDFPNNVLVTFYDANPLTGPANNLGLTSFGTVGADSCLNGTLFNVAADLQLANGATIYAVVNFDGSLPAPFSFDDFPVTNIEECNYLNNLDSSTLQLPNSPTLELGPDVILCDDSTVVFDAGAGFYKYLWQDGSTGQTFAANDPGVYWVEATDSCGFKQRDSVLLTVSLLPDTQFPDTVICQSYSVFYSLPGFDTYAWAPAAGLSCTDCSEVIATPAVTTTYTVFATTVNGCVLADTFEILVIPTTKISTTIEFCPGESVTIGGVVHDQPGTVIDTTTGPNGCDLITTYTLQYLTDPNAAVTIDCIEDINIATQPGTGPIVVGYDLPATASDCPCPGVALMLTEGLPPGSLFPLTTTKVCYEAKDNCGNTADCCFNVTVREELPCDVKQIGCMKYELLQIIRNAATLDLSYKIRVTNNCANKMIYTAIQIPNGMVAEAPANNSIFTTQAGRNYDVRNPNFSPFYSIRFKSTTDSIANGESDIFEHTLPPQINPAYIHITARLFPQLFFEAHLNTFNCPIEIVQYKPGQRADLTTFSRMLLVSNLRVFPNPSSGTLFADLSDWRGERVQVQILDSRGQRVQHLSLTADAAPQKIQLLETLPGGLYFLEILTTNGEKRAARFVVQR